MFSEELEKIDWEETTKTIYSKTESDVLRALGKEHCDVDDFMALISPAAAKYLEPMAQLSKKYTEERFGKTISMFIPLYITNSCTNSCVYCGFHISNPMARTILTPEQIEDEYKAIKKLGPFENLLLVTGENPAKAGVPYLAKALDIAKKYFSNLKIEVMPLKAEEYAELKEHGLNGVICFQETYNKARYNIYHPRGMKSKFEWQGKRLRPHGSGRSPLHWHGSTYRTGRMAHRCDHDGLSLTLSSEKVLENQIQCQLPPYASGRKRWFPAECHHE